MATSIRRAEVDLTGLMRVLGQHLYSTPNVVVRELIQNAHDSCVRRASEANDAPDPLIRVTAVPDEGRIEVEDNGAGLTAAEIESYLATIGRGQTAESRRGGVDGLIGYFGLGFLSAYVVAEVTDVWTASHASPDVAWRFTSRSGQSYTIEPAEPRAVGTRVSLRLKTAYRSMSRPETLAALVRRYCCLLPIAVELGDGGARVGAEPPPWRATGLSKLRRRKLELEFAEQFDRFAPLCTLPVESANPGDGPAQGVLWIQDGSTYGNADNRRVSLFVRGMMITDDARWLLPDWATFVGAVVESDVLAPTASREDIQRDETFDRVCQIIADSLMDGLVALAEREPQTWRRVILRHNEALLGASLCDARLFRLVAERLTVPTTMGDLHVAEVLRRSGGTVHVTRSSRQGVEGLMFRARSIPVVQGTRYGALAFCRRYTESRGGGFHVIGEREDPTQLGLRPEPGDPDPRLARWFGTPSTRVIAARFAPRDLPFVPLVDRSQELKRRIESDKADAAIGAATLALARQFTARIEEAETQRLYINLDCPAIQAVLDADTDARAEQGAVLLRSVLSMLAAHGEFEELPPLDQALAELGAAVTTLVRSASPG